MRSTLEYLILFPEFMQCLIELYKCQEIGQRNCPQAKGCVLIEPVVTEESETGEFEGSGLEGSYLPPSGGSVGLGTKPQLGSTNDVGTAAENPHDISTSTTNNPVHGGSGGQNRKFNIIQIQTVVNCCRK